MSRFFSETAFQEGCIVGFVTKKASGSALGGFEKAETDEVQVEALVNGRRYRSGGLNVDRYSMTKGTWPLFAFVSSVETLQSQSGNLLVNREMRRGPHTF
jgi:hypothetical protein